MGGFRRFVPPNKETSVSRPACINVNPPALCTVGNIDEDWTNISCIKKRRRMQNRNAQVHTLGPHCVNFLTIIQRKYRIRKRQTLAHLKRLEDTVSAYMNAIDWRPTPTANACSGEQPMIGEPPVSSIPDESAFMDSAGANLPITISLPNPQATVYIIDDKERHNMYTDADVRCSADPHSTNFSLFEDMKPSMIYDKRENLLVSDMAICPLAMSYISLANLWMPQQPELGAIK